jgi:hypothetical protein
LGHGRYASESRYCNLNPQTLKKEAHLMPGMWKIVLLEGVQVFCQAVMRQLYK